MAQRCSESLKCRAPAFRPPLAPSLLLLGCALLFACSQPDKEVDARTQVILSGASLTRGAPRLGLSATQVKQVLRAELEGSGVFRVSDASSGPLAARLTLELDGRTLTQARALDSERFGWDARLLGAEKARRARGSDQEMETGTVPERAGEAGNSHLDAELGPELRSPDGYPDSEQQPEHEKRNLYAIEPPQKGPKLRIEGSKPAENAEGAAADGVEVKLVLSYWSPLASEGDQPLVLKEAAKSSDPELALEAATREGVAHLVELLRKRGQSADELEGWIEDLDSRQPHLRDEALRELAARRHPAALPVLLKELKEGDDQRAAAALSWLVALKPPKLERLIIEQSERRNLAFVFEALHALGAVGGEMAEVYLELSRGAHPDPRVRAAANLALESLQRRGGLDEDAKAGAAAEDPQDSDAQRELARVKNRDVPSEQLPEESSEFLEDSSETASEDPSEGSSERSPEERSGQSLKEGSEESAEDSREHAESRSARPKSESSATKSSNTAASGP